MSELFNGLFSRKNFGDRVGNTATEIECILVALDALSSSRYKTASKIPGNTLIPLYVFDSLQKAGLYSYFSLTEKGLCERQRLLSLHDAMMVGGTLQLKPGTYRHFKGNHYNVLGTGENTETKELFAWYQPLAGPKQFVKSERPLSMFTQVVYRPECNNYLGPRWQLVHAFDQPCFAPFQSGENWSDHD